MAKQNDCSDLWQVALVMEPSQALKGKVFSITGHLGIKREDVVQIIKTAGGQFEERPRYGVHFLITNKEWNAGSTVQKNKSSKLIDAERMGVKILSEKQFCQMVIDGDESAPMNKPIG